MQPSVAHSQVSAMQPSSLFRAVGTCVRAHRSLAASWAIRAPPVGGSLPRRIGRQQLLLVRAAGGGTVVVVESPAKAKKIQGFLGQNYKVLASYGHVRDLPSRDGSVLPEADFAVRWELSKRGREKLQLLREAMQGAQRLVLATDPDREGEAISWHVLQELEAAATGMDVQRITFTEVTPRAIKAAMEAPRGLALPLVDAYLARRALDYLVGFNLSPVLWRKLPGARSAGRVQSVALRLVCEREAEIDVFRSQEYWSIEAGLSVAQGPDGQRFSAALVQLGGKKVDKGSLVDAAAAEAAAARIRAAQLQVKSVTSKTVQRTAGPPFITSTLQQAAASKLGFSASRTMQVAQQLYEGESFGEGLITYMRTDGVSLSAESVEALRETATDLFGPEAVPPQPRVFKSKAKNAQEAHEAIRPTTPSLHPRELPSSMPREQVALYDLIWRRAVACQMANAQMLQVRAEVASEDGGVVLRSTGSKVVVPGYLAVYDDLRKGPEEEAEAAEGAEGGDEGAEVDKNAILAELQEGQAVAQQGVDPKQHFTKPPPRYTEGALVKALEELGIGRPSTYAPILSLLQNRGYVVKEGRALRAVTLGRVLVAFLQQYFPTYVDYGFTSGMELQLDEVAGGQAQWQGVLRDFWGPFHTQVGGASQVRVTEVVDALDAALGPHFFPPLPSGEDPRRCPACGTGRLGFKPSKMGGFIGCSNYQGGDEGGCTYLRPLEVLTGESADRAASGGEAGFSGGLLTGPRSLGKLPGTEEEVMVKLGPYGPYVQISGGEGTKPRNVALPKGLDATWLTVEDVVPLLALPRQLGPHPTDGEPVVASTGRFGPYVQHKAVFAALPKGGEPMTVTLEEALPLLLKRRERMLARGRDPDAPPKKGKGRAKAGGKKAAGAAKGRPAKAAADAAPRRGKAAAGGGPKKKLSPYFVFQSQMREEAKKELPPGAKVGDVSKVLGRMWRELPDAEKEKYKDGGAAAEGGDAGGAAAQASTSGQGAAAGRGEKQAGTAEGAGSSGTAGRGRSRKAPGAGRGAAGSGVAAPAAGAEGVGEEARAGGKGGKGGKGGRKLTGWQMFCKVNMGKPSFREIVQEKRMAALGAAWKALDASSREYYEQGAAAAALQGSGGGGSAGGDSQ